MALQGQAAAWQGKLVTCELLKSGKQHGQAANTGEDSADLAAGGGSRLARRSTRSAERK